MILTISHQKGGVGKSTIAWNIAVHFSKLLPTTIIDLDTQQSLTQTNQIRESVGLEPLKIMQISNAGELAQYIEKDSQERLTIIDSGGFDSAFNRVAIVGSDMLITPVSDKPFDLMGLQKYEEILKSLSAIQKETIKTNILFNNLNPAMKNFGDLIEFVCSSEYFELMTSVLRQRVDISNSIGAGKSVKEYRIFSKADREFDELFQEIQKRINI
ncbi:MAG: ParA family protein [Sulfurospirillum sp.]|nr:ParA family protein [Sulfurospirillum sp.]